MQRWLIWSVFVCVLAAAQPASAQTTAQQPASAQTTATAQAKAPRPNVVLIMADDMGYSDIGCYGSEIETPVLDKLAARGLRFAQFYNNARCCPTRASLMTGLYPHQTGVGLMMEDLGLPGYRGNLNRQCVTIAEVLRGAGYATFMSGKWHLTSHVTAQSDAQRFNWPLQRGFQRYYGTIRGAGNYFAPESLIRDNQDISAEAARDPDYYYTDALAKNASQFVKEHVQAQPQQPFFLYLAFTAPHWPMHAPAASIAKYRGKYREGWDALRQARYERQLKLGLIDAKWKLSPRSPEVPAWENVGKRPLPKEWQDIPGATQENVAELLDLRMAIYAAMVDHLDQGVGRLVKTLEETGQLDNTLLIFLADNGGCAESGIYGFSRENCEESVLGSRVSFPSYGACWANLSNTPFRRYKHDTFAGGMSSPFLVHWPSRIPAGGQIRRQVGHLVDIMPTIVEVAGATYPREYRDEKILPMEGISLVPALQDQPLTRTAPLCWEHHGNRAVLDGQWKIVADTAQGAWELYDVDADRTELHNLAAAQPERVARMSAMWDAWAERVHAVRNPQAQAAKKQKKAAQ